MNFSQRYDINMKLHQKLGIVLKNQDLSSTYLLTILFTRFWMWLLMRFFAYLRYSYSMEHQLSQSYLTKLVRNRIWLQIQTEIQFADSTDSMQVCFISLLYIIKSWFVGENIILKYKGWIFWWCRDNLSIDMWCDEKKKIFYMIWKNLR